MADQDFNIKVVTTADTTGLRQVGEQMDAIAKRQADAEAKWARSPINPRNQTGAGGGGIASLGAGGAAASNDTGLTGTAIGLGTIVTVLTRALNQWKEFNAEQDKYVEGVIRANEKSRELGLSVSDMLDAMKSEERIDTEPLEESLTRLTHDARVLKEEMKAAFATGAFEDVKRYASALGVVESQINRVTSAIDRQAAEEKRAAEQRERAAEKERQAQESFLAGATGSASAQTKAILANEDAFRRTGDPAFQRTAEALRRSATPDQAAEADQLGRALNPPPPRPGRAAGVGESQDIVDQIERNRINSEKAQRGDTDVVRAINELRDLWK